MKAHVPVYRPILKHALETAWTHRELWPIAAVAGLAGTGAVVNDVLNQAKLAAALPSSDFSQIFENLRILKAYQENVIFATPEQITVGTIILVVVAASLALAIAASQQIMLRVAHRATIKKTRVELKEIRHELWHPRLFRFLGLDLLLKLMVANLMLATTVLVSSLNIATIFTDAFFGSIFSVMAFSLALTLNVLAMLSLIGVARKDLGFSAAITYAWKLYRGNWLLCLEMSALLFAINFLISAAYDGTILILGVPAALSFLGAVEAGSFATYVGLMALTALVVVAVTLAFAGFATTFTYTAWVALAEKLDKRAISPRMVEHGKRFVGNLRS